MMQAIKEAFIQAKKDNATLREALTMKVPTKPGFYWAKWRIIEDGSDTEQDAIPPLNMWEVVEVWENTEKYLVSVTGESKSQSVENFVWGPGPLTKPE